MVTRDPHADHPTQREPTEGHAVEPQTVEQMEQVATEVLDSVRAGRYRRSAVAAVVISKHP